MDIAEGRKPTRLLRHRAEHPEEAWDWLAEEAPLEIVLSYLHGHTGARVESPLVVTMRTPGDDEVLGLGLLLAEGLIAGPEAIEGMETAPLATGGHRLTIALRHPPQRSLQDRQRGLYANSSCGVCGKAALDRMHLPAVPVLDPLGPVLSHQTLQGLPARLREHQGNFEHTGGLHAAALFSAEGTMYQLFEDIGRHNALDKVLGEAARAGRWPLDASVLVLSGRIGFELVQKAAVAAIPIIAAIGAPSSLAVELAQHFGQTLVGFLREDRFNLYTHPQRIDRG